MDRLGYSPCTVRNPPPVPRAGGGCRSVSSPRPDRRGHLREPEAKPVYREDRSLLGPGRSRSGSGHDRRTEHPAPRHALVAGHCLRDRQPPGEHQPVDPDGRPSRSDQVHQGKHGLDHPLDPLYFSGPGPGRHLVRRLHEHLFSAGPSTSSKGSNTPTSAS